MTFDNRRRVLRGISSLVIAGAAFNGGMALPVSALAQTGTGKHAGPVKALFFDVFGTLVDWRTSVARESRDMLEPLGHQLDWIAFADAWRAEYQPAMEEIRSGRKPFSKLDVVHRWMLDRIRPRFGLQQLDEATLRELNLAWHRLDAWEDVPSGLKLLRDEALLAPCSNGNIALMADLARRNDFHWDAILGAEIAGDYKPKPKVYLAAAEAFNLAPSQCMMVAAHSGDLKAAGAVGLRTAHVVRADEFGPNTGERSPTVSVDFAVQSLAELYSALSTLA